MLRVPPFLLLLLALCLPRAGGAQVLSHEVGPGEMPASLLGSSYADLLVSAPTYDATAEASTGKCKPATKADLRNAGSVISGGVAKIVVPVGKCPVQVSVTSYVLPGGAARPFEHQVVFDNKTATYGPGTHIVRVNLPPCAWQSDIYLGPVIPTLIPNVGHPTDKIVAWSLNEGAGCSASLGDRIWLDQNRNGLQDAGEPGINGVTVTLFNDSNVQVAQQMTSNGGYYLFQGLTPGTYHFKLSGMPAGHFVTQQNAGGDEVRDSDMDASGTSDAVTLTWGQHYRDLDGGLYVAGVQPLLESVTAQCDGTFRASFGYLNEGPAEVMIAAGLDNFFLPLDVEQTTAFQPGRVEDAFSVAWSGTGALIWTLKGPDGKRRTVLATTSGAAPAQGCLCDDPTSAPSYAGGYVLNTAQTRAFVEVMVPAGGTTFEFYKTRNLVVGEAEDVAEALLPGVTRAGNVFTFASASPTTVRFPISRLEAEVPGVAFFLKVTDTCGRTVDVDPDFTLAGVEGGAAVAFALAQNLPNPAIGQTAITFSLETASDVRLVVYDVLGRAVATLAEGMVGAGQHTVRLDASDLPAGQYLYRLQAGTQTLTRVMTVVR